MSDLRDIFSNNLRKFRKLRGFTQDDLAEKSKLSTGTLKAYEAKRRWPEKIYLEAIAVALGIDESELFVDNTAKSFDERILEYTPKDPQIKSLTKSDLESIVRSSVKEEISSQSKANLSDEENELLTLFRTLTGRKKKIIFDLIQRQVNAPSNEVKLKTTTGT